VIEQWGEEEILLSVVNSNVGSGRHRKKCSNPFGGALSTKPPIWMQEADRISLCDCASTAEEIDRPRAKSCPYVSYPIPACLLRLSHSTTNK